MTDKTVIANTWPVTYDQHSVFTTYMSIADEYTVLWDLKSIVDY